MKRLRFSEIDMVPAEEASATPIEGWTGGDVYRKDRHYYLKEPVIFLTPV